MDPLPDNRIDAIPKKPEHVVSERLQSNFVSEAMLEDISRRLDRRVGKDDIYKIIVMSRGA